jgi:hypothetical protein
VTDIWSRKRCLTRGLTVVAMATLAGIALIGSAAAILLPGEARWMSRKRSALWSGHNRRGEAA